MIKLTEYVDKIYESINDKNLFKAVFLCGGPGSGKSFIGELVLSGLGTNTVNSDIMFEALMKTNNISMKIDKSKPDIIKIQDELRERAKKFAKFRETQWINGMLPIILDGTGKDYHKIEKLYMTLTDRGYDCSMIFVNTTLDVALERNRKRDRTVPEDAATSMWKAVQNNIGGFQKLFGNNDFYIIDNSKKLDEKEIKELSKRLTKIGIKLINSPLKNPKGKLIIDKLKEIGGKYLSDLVDA